MNSSDRLPIDTLSGIRLQLPIFDLRELDPRLEGILSPGYSAEELSQHVHDVFLEHADKFLEFCPIDRESIEYWKGIIRDALGTYSPRRIIDIGSGGGTTVFPLLELFPGSQVIATDLALPLLAELRNRARRDGYKGLDVVQMNAEKMIFADREADLIIGANVLHHALSLENMFQEIRRVLLPGAKAVFWEPFENGAQLLACIFDLWDELNPHQPEQIPKEVIWSLRT
ncbi:MAG: class I SAM-dependent methyltransferase [Terriglobales bacterium]|jgi:ubiquinone/menaquinone biosynthesis C-methylase UbiE